MERSARSKKDKFDLFLTGRLGETMQESAHIATTVARQKLHRIDPSNNFFDSSQVHLHVPEVCIKCYFAISVEFMATHRVCYTGRYDIV